MRRVVFPASPGTPSLPTCPKAQVTASQSALIHTKLERGQATWYGVGWGGGWGRGHEHTRETAHTNSQRKGRTQHIEHPVGGVDTGGNPAAALLSKVVHKVPAAATHRAEVHHLADTHGHPPTGYTCGAPHTHRAEVHTHRVVGPWLHPHEQTWAAAFQLAALAPPPLPACEVDFKCGVHVAWLQWHAQCAPPRVGCTACVTSHEPVMDQPTARHSIACAGSCAPGHHVSAAGGCRTGRRCLHWVAEGKKTQHRRPSWDDDKGVGRHLHSVPVVPMVTDHKPSECHGNGHLRSTHVDCGDDSAPALGYLLDDFHHHTRRPAVQATRGLICKTCAQPGTHTQHTRTIRKKQQQGWKSRPCVSAHAHKHASVRPHAPHTLSQQTDGMRGTSTTNTPRNDGHAPRNRTLGLVTSSTPIVNRLRSPTLRPLPTVPTTESATCQRAHQSHSSCAKWG
jgi:hypothetical protein